MHGEVVLLEESVGQAGGSAPSSLPVVLPNALDEGEHDLHCHMAGMVNMCGCAAAPACRRPPLLKVSLCLIGLAWGSIGFVPFSL